MPSFNELAWAALIYWAASYGGNIEGDKPYVDLMQMQEILCRLRESPQELELDEIKGSLVKFLNEWRSMLSNSSEMLARIKNGLVESIPHLSCLSDTPIAEFNLSAGSDAIRGFFDELLQVKGIGPTSAAKIAHILRPQLFVPWDRDICSHFEKEKLIPKGGDGRAYVEFLHVAQGSVLDVIADFRSSHPGQEPDNYLSRKLNCPIAKSMAKFIDEYNWITITKKLPVPPPWWPS